MDRATSKICRAISLGVFLRDAPSTMAIILIQKAFARLAGDPDHDPVGQDGGAAGDGAAVAARSPG